MLQRPPERFEALIVTDSAFVDDEAFEFCEKSGYLDVLVRPVADAYSL